MFYDLLYDAVVVLDVDVVAGEYADEVRAHAFGVADHGAGFDAVGFCFVAGGDGAGVVGLHGNNCYGLAAKMRVFILLDAREVAVEVEE